MSEGGRHHRTPTKEELALWAHAMRDAKALKRKGALLSTADERTAVTVDAPAEQRILSPQIPSKVTPIARPSCSPAAAAPVGTLDRRQTRLIATGRAEIDARLDLHGMRQNEAHAALKGFLISAQNRGCRVVLVITGKGSRSETESGSGVLRRLVPLWLQEPEFRQSVISFGASDARHGGIGALYIRVRKKDRSRKK